MTRKAYKLRDVIDVRMMEKEFGYSVSDHKAEIKEKARFMIERYERYRENIELTHYPDIEFPDSEEMNLLLAKVPKDMNEDIARIHQELELLREELL